MSTQREFPDQPVVGVGGVVIVDSRAVLVRRGSAPLKGEWSIPGGRLELGETLVEGVQRELREETGLEVRVLELLDVFERIVPEERARPQYHFVILDYLCEAASGVPRPGGDVTEVALVSEDELGGYGLTPAATRVLRKAFALARQRGRS